MGRMTGPRCLQAASDEEHDMMLSAKPFAAAHASSMVGTLSHSAAPGPPSQGQCVSRQPAVQDNPGGTVSAQRAAMEVGHANGFHPLCPGNELDYTSTAAALAAVHAVAAPSRRYGHRGAAGGVRQQHDGIQGPGATSNTVSVGQQRPFIRRNLTRDETAGARAY